MNTKESNRWTEILFHLGMWWRIIYGFLRIIIAVLLLQHVGTPVSDIFLKLMSHELIQDPNDRVIQMVNHLPYLVTYYLAFYFMFWGVMDIFMSILLLRHQLWAFPVAIYMIVVFIVYELFRFFHTHSLMLLAVIGMDVFIIWIIKREYKKLKS
ncbi:hypothetical protein CO026_03625 [Candidatus Kaiserbacteria bacterium CG_4_9_14_0_2_um_filter_41_32]|uniref:DUF2127 domain-containing protein n=1 Tax=Candidatus Kaiserbacteria bacterium CG_4_9_14_0_2_um_filter_41_32 TaxID=1974601 RepID=A0A2M8FDW7_9BACT|nr:MAG: hypothetical protein CO026_03625 [Candidatus Kaiserbacteria bacterium CG_4_9_14_0_2_um_filter_41_32]